MATAKFKGDSVYNQRLPKPTQEDYIYKRHVSDFEMQRGDANHIIGLAIFGIGRAGTIHLHGLVRNPRVKLLYIVEEDRSKWEAIRNYWNVPQVTFLTCAEAGPVFEDKNVQAVVVTSPTKTHETIVMQALDNNKAVFCEKPIAESIEKARKCFDKAREVNLPLMTAFNRRFDAAFSSVRERVRNGEVGHVNIIKTCSRDCPPPGIEYLKVSGGIFYDTAVHNIDTLIWILGEYPTKVSVAASANILEVAEIGDFDTVVIMLSFPSGTIGIIDLSRYSSYGHDQRLEVFGFKGMLQVNNQQPLQGVESFSAQHTTCPIFYSFASRFHSSYEIEMEHFLDVVAGKDLLKVDPKDVLAVSKVAAACDRAAKTGQAVEIKWNSEEIPLN